MRRSQLLVALAAATLLPTSTDADVYAYDARGRLVGACHMAAGDVRRVEYLLDGADNRSEYRNLAVVTVLPAGSSIYSADGRFQLVMQGDGNLVLYGPNGYLWATFTSGANNTMVMQPDGNLVVYNSAGAPLWASWSNTYTCARMTLQTDGNLVIYDLALRPVWATNTGGH